MQWKLPNNPTKNAVNISGDIFIYFVIASEFSSEALFSIVIDNFVPVGLVMTRLKVFSIT